MKNIQRVLRVETLAQMYLIRDQDTGLYGIQMSNGRVNVEPVYELDEEYDLTKEYDMINISQGRIYMVEKRT